MTEIEFPAVTICSQGLNMENVARAVERDFYHWHKKTQVMESKISSLLWCWLQESERSKRHTLEDQMSIYLLEKFDIGEDDPSLLGKN